MDNGSFIAPLFVLPWALVMLTLALVLIVGLALTINFAARAATRALIHWVSSRRARAKRRPSDA